MIVASTVVSGNESKAHPRDPQEAELGAPPLIVIAGPTAVGKTTLGIELALDFNGEVVNADSRYLYRGFDVGVAKPNPEERKGVPHHLIDVLDPSEPLSLALYQRMAYDTISDVYHRAKLPFLVGGTPLYVNAVIEGWKIPSVSPDPKFRSRLERDIDQFGVESISQRLVAIDPEAARRCANNPRRIIRALEIYEKTGVPMSSLQSKGPRPYRTLEIGLLMPRKDLYRTIDHRVDNQIRNGLVEEAKHLLASGVDPDGPAFSSIGYRQLLPYFRNEFGLEVAIENIKHDTHRYVRHQETWLRRNGRLHRIDVQDRNWIDSCRLLVSTFLDANH